MKRQKFMALAFTTMCCMVSVSVLELKTAAASSTESVGDFSAIENQVVWHSEDIAYLNRELDVLYSEIGDTVSGGDTVEGIVSDSADKRRNLITSHGIINYGNGKVVANAASLLALADKTDSLADAYASAASNALNDIGTYFNTEGGINHESQAAGSIMLNCAQIVEGILQSQSVEHLAAVPVIEDNITAGAAAWVNGKCIIGNGADNQKAYQRGVDDGEEESDEDVDIRYTYHVHTGESGKDPIPDGDVYHSLTDPGGCYVASGHNHGYGGCSICTGTATLNSGSVNTRDDGLTYGAYNCNKCGSVQYAHSGPDGVLPSSLSCGTCTSKKTNTWKVNCGKKAGQVESAEVIIHTHKEKYE